MITDTEYPEIMNRREAARYLRISDRGFRRYLADGFFPGTEIKLRRKRLYRKSALDRALAKLETSEV